MAAKGSRHLTGLLGRRSHLEERDYNSALSSTCTQAAPLVAPLVAPLQRSWDVPFQLNTGRQVHTEAESEIDVHARFCPFVFVRPFSFVFAFAFEYLFLDDYGCPFMPLSAASVYPAITIFSITQGALGLWL